MRFSAVLAAWCRHATRRRRQGAARRHPRAHVPRDHRRDCARGGLGRRGCRRRATVWRTRSPRDAGELGTRVAGQTGARARDGCFRSSSALARSMVAMRPGCGRSIILTRIDAAHAARHAREATTRPARVFTAVAAIHRFAWSLFARLAQHVGDLDGCAFSTADTTTSPSTTVGCARPTMRADLRP